MLGSYWFKMGNNHLGFRISWNISKYQHEHQTRRVLLFKLLANRNFLFYCVLPHSDVTKINRNRFSLFRIILTFTVKPAVYTLTNKLEYFTALLDAETYILSKLYKTPYEHC